MNEVVIVGVDGSSTAAGAARRAARLADGLRADLRVVCSFEKAGMNFVESDGLEYVFSTEEAALSVAEETLRSLRKTLPELSGQAVAREGRPAEILLEEAAETAATIIVVGNKHVQGARRFLGSIATEIAHKADCDVYIAHTHSRP